MASKDVIVDRDLFLNLGRVQNLSLDVSGALPTLLRPVIVDQINEIHDDSGSGNHEESFKQMVMRPTLQPETGYPRELGNRVTSYGPNHPRAVFLQNLRVGNADWLCSCDGIG